MKGESVLGILNSYRKNWLTDDPRAALQQRSTPVRALCSVSRRFADEREGGIVAYYLWNDEGAVASFSTQFRFL